MWCLFICYCRCLAFLTSPTGLAMRWSGQWFTSPNTQMFRHLLSPVALYVSSVPELKLLSWFLNFELSPPPPPIPLSLCFSFPIFLLYNSDSGFRKKYSVCHNFFLLFISKNTLIIYKKNGCNGSKDLN